MKITKYLILLLALITNIFAAQDGDLDTTFGTNGRVVDPVSENGSFASGIAVEDDGNIIAIGQVGNTDVGTNWFAARYNTNGARIDTFSPPSPFADQSAASAVAIQSDGKIVVTGAVIPGSFQFATVRYLRDGTLDPEFGTGGIAETPNFANRAAIAFAIAIQQDGKIVVVGATTRPDPINFAVARYNTDGTLDSSFGNNGTVLTSINNADGAFSVAIQADGKIVVVGVSTNSGLNQFAVARYLPNGDLDPSFRGGGKFTENLIPTQSQSGKAVVIQSDGKIVVGGTFGKIGVDTTQFAIARYNSNGTNDTTFGALNTGYQSSEFSDTADLRALAIQSDGKIIAVGLAKQDSPEFYGLLRLTITGARDSTFGTNGQVTTSFNLDPFNLPQAEANAVAIQQDGKIIAAGSGTSDGIDVVTMARYIVNNTPLHLPTIQPTTDGTAISGLAQNLSFLTIYDITADPNNPIEICNSVTQPSLISSDTNGSWTCTGLNLTPGVHNLRIVSRYKTSNVNLLSELTITVISETFDIEKLGPNRILAGSFIDYVINVTNTGPNATNVQIVDQLPEEVTFVSASGAPFTRVDNTVTFTIPSIVSGQTRQLRIRGKVANLTESRVITNTVISPSGEEIEKSTFVIALSCNLIG